ncbi:nucleotidyltransferase domain-containing protein [bacterium]|nr:nucleotidyltransferase domain-containing protein [bacterium]
MIDLQPDYLNQVRQILQQYIPGHKVWAYGSRVQGQAHPYSDFDLAIISTSPVNDSTMSKIKETFAQSDLPIMIDIRDWHELSKHFRNIIQSNYEVLQ